jgi:large subunit ribosomal protein L24
MTIRKGDRVRVITGKDKGKEGKVLRSVPEKQRVVVENVHMIKKHTRPSQKNPQGGIIERTAFAPAYASRVARTSTSSPIVALRWGQEVPPGRKSVGRENTSEV